MSVKQWQRVDHDMKGMVINPSLFMPDSDEQQETLW